MIALSEYRIETLYLSVKWTLKTALNSYTSKAILMHYIFLRLLNIKDGGQ